MLIHFSFHDCINPNLVTYSLCSTYSMLRPKLRPNRSFEWPKIRFGRSLKLPLRSFITTCEMKQSFESLSESTQHPKFHFPPELDFSKTRHTRTRHLKIREHPYPPEPVFFHTRPNTSKNPL